MPLTSSRKTCLWWAAWLVVMAPAGPLWAADAAAPAASAPKQAVRGTSSSTSGPAEAASPAARAALEQLLGLPAAGSAASAAAGIEARTTTTVREGETLDRIIRRTMGNTPFKDSLLQAAFVEANPRAYPNGSIQRLPVGTVLHVPSAADLRRHLARALGPDRAAALAGGAPAPASGHVPGPAAVPARPASSAAAPPPPPPRPDHRGWVRFPG